MATANGHEQEPRMDANKISRKGAKVKTTTADEHGFTQIEADNSREGHKEGPRMATANGRE
jgi:hypothetical protein